MQRLDYYPQKQNSQGMGKHLKIPPKRAKRKEIEG